MREMKSHLENVSHLCIPIIRIADENTLIPLNSQMSAILQLIPTPSTRLVAGYLIMTPSRVYLPLDLSASL